VITFLIHYAELPPAEHLPKEKTIVIPMKQSTAVEKSFGLDKGGFVLLCNRNYENANKIALENNPVAILIYQFMKNEYDWLGTASELLAEIFIYADEVTKRNPLFPQTPQKLSNILDRLAPGFLLEGIKIDKGDHLREGGTGNRRIKITKTVNSSSQSSHSSQSRITRKFHSENIRKKTNKCFYGYTLPSRRFCASQKPLTTNW